MLVRRRLLAALDGGPQAGSATLNERSVPAERPPDA